MDKSSKNAHDGQDMPLRLKQSGVVFAACALPWLLQALAGQDLLGPGGEAIATWSFGPVLGIILGLYIHWGLSVFLPFVIGSVVLFWPEVGGIGNIERGAVFTALCLAILISGFAVRVTGSGDMGLLSGADGGNDSRPAGIEENTAPPVPAMVLFILLGPICAAALSLAASFPLLPVGSSWSQVVSLSLGLLVGFLVFTPLVLVILLECRCQRPSMKKTLLVIGLVFALSIGAFHCGTPDSISRELSSLALFPVMIWVGFTAPPRLSLSAMAAVTVIAGLSVLTEAPSGGLILGENLFPISFLPEQLTGYLIALAGSILMAITASVPLRQRQAEIGAICQTVRLSPMQDSGSQIGYPSGQVNSLQQLVDSAPTAGALVSASGPILYANEAYAGLVLGSVETLKQPGWSLRGVDSTTFFANPQDRQNMVDLMHRYGRVQGQQYRLKRQDGDVIWVQEWWVPVSLDDFSAVLTWCVDITDRKRDEEALRTSERRLRDILDESPAGVLISREGGKIVYANPKAAALLGAPRALLIGEDGRKFYHDSEHRKRIGRRLRAGQTVIDEEVVFSGADGQVRTCLLSVLPMKYDGRQAWLSWSYDITARKDMENALQVSERRLRSILEACPLGLAVLSAEGAPRYLNPALMTQLGVESPSMVTDPASLLLDRWARGRIAYHLSRGLTPPACEARMTAADGTVFWVLLSFEQGLFEGKQAFFVWAANIDTQKSAEKALTDHRDELKRAVQQSTQKLEHLNKQLSWELEQRKMVERRIRQGRIYLRAVLDTVADGIITLDHEGRIEDYNPSAESLFAFQRHLHLGYPITELFCFQSPEGVLPLDDLFHDLGVDRELTARAITGREFPASLVISSASVEERPIYTCVVRDITDQKQAQAALLQAKDEAELASRSKSDFLANMSHELRTPLNAILGFSEVMQSEMYGPIGEPRYLEYAGLIQQSGRHLLDVINDILDIARIEAGQVTLYEEDVDIEDMVRSAKTLIEPRVHELRQKLRITLAPELPHLLVDRRRFKQMLLNLLSNASKFTGQGGTITVRAYEAAAGFVVEVEDTGIGMTEDECEKVLLPFIQGDGGLARRYDGTGLGLPLVLSMATMHGAALVLDSEPGRGTVARLTFPRERMIWGSGGDNRQQVSADEHVG